MLPPKKSSTRINRGAEDCKTNLLSLGSFESNCWERLQFLQAAIPSCCRNLIFHVAQCLRIRKDCDPRTGATVISFNIRDFMPAKLGLAVAFLIALTVANPVEATPSNCDAVVDNLLQNCGFEDGLVHWGPPYPENPASVTGDVHSGGKAAALNVPGLDGYSDPALWQFVLLPSATPELLNLNFWIKFEGTTGELNATLWGGGGAYRYGIFSSGLVPGCYPSSCPYTIAFAEPGKWTEFTISGVEGDDAVALFYPGFDVAIDDVTLTQASVPESATLTLFVIGLASFAAFRCRRATS